MEGLVFGLIDNGVMLLGACLGIEFMPNRKGLGALIGSGFGNAFSDFLAGLGEGGFRFGFGALIGCLLAMVIIPLLKRRVKI